MSDETEEGLGNPWSTIGYGLFAIVLGVGLFCFFEYKEAEGGSFRMNAIILIIYETLGKYGVLGILSGFGALLTLLGLKDLMTRKE